MVITGEGKAFVAGADILEISTLDNISGTEFALEGQEVFNKIEQCSKPVIAAVHGPCIGGAVDMICACDIRYCSQDAWFQIKVLRNISFFMVFFIRLLLFQRPINSDVCPWSIGSSPAMVHTGIPYSLWTSA